MWVCNKNKTWKNKKNDVCGGKVEEKNKKIVAYWSGESLKFLRVKQEPTKINLKKIWKVDIQFAR